MKWIDKLTRHICTHCGRIAQESHLICTQKDCPAQTTPILGYGTLMGDVEVNRLLHVTKTATLYEGRRSETRVLLKVAHPTSEAVLRNEAKVFGEISMSRNRLLRPGLLARITGIAWLTRKFGRKLDPYPGMPVLLPAYASAPLSEFPSGQALIGDKTYYYEVFAYVEAVVLRDLLNQMPMPWYPNVAWFVMGIAQQLDFLHREYQVLHLNLNPDGILVRVDKNGYLFPIIIDLGLTFPLKSPSVDADVLQWLYSYAAPSYVAPELTMVETGDLPVTAISPRTDVYGLGLLFHEMLSGKPVYPFRLERASDIRFDVLRGNFRRLIRRDLRDPARIDVESQVERIALDAGQTDPGQRISTPHEFYQRLHTIFNDIPRPEYQPTTGELLLRVILSMGIIVGVLVLLSIL